MRPLFRINEALFVKEMRALAIGRGEEGGGGVGGGASVSTSVTSPFKYKSII